MPKNGANTGKSSKTARVLSLLTDPAASLLGGSRNNKDDDRNEAVRQTRGLDDAATESRIQASLAAEEDSLVSELFGKKEPPRSRPAQSAEAATPAPPPPPSEPAAPEPDPRTLELLSMLSNPSTLGNSAMPPVEERRPVTTMDFADELTAGMAEQPKFQPEPEPEPEPPTVKPYVPQQFTPQPPQRQQAQPAPQQTRYTPQAAPQQPQYAQPAPQQPQYAPQPQQAAPQQPQYAPQPQQAAPQQPQYAPQPQQAAPPKKPKPAEHHDEFVCFNLTQAMVENKADKLMKQFGMCTCNRCKVDVTAIALSNLPAKYVATQNRDVLPLLSMYEEKYSAAVTVQVMNACRMVMKRPHHGR